MNQLLKRLMAIGPGAMVAAAFIGPGTVLMSLKAGGQFGTSLLWAVAFSTLACIVLQEMTARLGVCARLGLGEAIRRKTSTPQFLIASQILVISAILIGNAAYESGNISGAGTGALLAFPSLANWSVNPVSILVGCIAFGVLLTGRNKLIERFLIGLVAIMGIAFLVMAISLKPDLGELARGLVPKIPEGGLLFVVGLIGTTVVPYNLFLHATASKKRWEDQAGYQDARLDTILSIAVGGLITAAILVAASIVLKEVTGKLDYSVLADHLKDRLGNWSAMTLFVGLVAAGLSSAITAPLAAAYATSEMLDMDVKNHRFRFNLVWIGVLVVGMACLLLGYRPTQLIVFAQVANGLLLPIVSLFLLWVMNDEKLLGEYKNGFVANLLGGIVIAVTIAIGARGIWMQLAPLFAETTTGS